MELRVIVEHTNESVETASKLFCLGEYKRCEIVLVELGAFLIVKYIEGMTTSQNIVEKPPENK